METYQQMQQRHKQEIKNLILQYNMTHTIAEAARIMGIDKDKLRRFAHYHGISFKKKYGDKMTKCDTVYRKKSVTIPVAPWEEVSHA